MKYAVLIGDGMNDYPLAELNGKTPLEVAKTSYMDFIVKNGEFGRVKTIPDNMSSGSDVAILSILGYDPKIYYSGRGPLEAANLGIDLKEDEVAFRCNLITAEENRLIDYSAGHITTEESVVLIDALNKRLGSSDIRFYSGVSYRHILILKSPPKSVSDSPETLAKNIKKSLPAGRQEISKIQCVAPHDIINQDITNNLPKGEGAQILINLMEESKKILANHEINQVRIDLKENPANMIWLWGQGVKPDMPTFKERFGLSGAVISAVDLIKGLGRLIGFEVINVPGATGYYDTDYQGKAKAALKALENKDFVFIHVEAPDEAGHNGDLRMKIISIERFDHFVVGTIVKYFKRLKNFRLLVLADHATPLSIRTHAADPVCFAIWGRGVEPKGYSKFNEKEATNTSLYLDKGHTLMEYFLKK